MFIYVYLWGPMGSQDPYLWGPMGSQGPGTLRSGTKGPGTLGSVPGPRALVFVLPICTQAAGPQNIDFLKRI